ncbi:UNVERIFIED_CONTAM: PAS domain S-box protein [Microbacterium sp. SLM126]
MDKAEEFLSDYEIPFKGIVEQSVAGIYILQDGRLQYVNETFAAMCNVPRSRMTGELLATLAAPHQVDALMDQYHKRIRGERPGPFVLHTKRRDGSRGYVEIHGNTVQYRGKPAIVGVGLDVTDRIQKQEELSRSRTQLRELMMRLNSVRERERSTVA